MSAASSGRTDGPGTGWTLECRCVERSDGSFRHAGRRLAYSSYGEGPRVVVLLHGLLFSRTCTTRSPGRWPSAATAW